jgi:hypothetical protein
VGLVEQALALKASKIRKKCSVMGFLEVIFAVNIFNLTGL